MLNTILTNLARSILSKVKTYSDATFVKSATLDADVAAAGYVKTADLPAGQDLSGYATIVSVNESLALKADAGAVDALASNVDAASISINTINATISAMSESVGLKADLSEVNSLVSAKADASSVTALTALVTNLTENAPETLDTFAEVAAAIQQGATDLGLAGLDQTAINAIVDAEWAALP